MKVLKSISFPHLLLLIVIAFLSGCASRQNRPVAMDENTLVYPSRDSAGLEVEISLFRKWDKKNQTRLGQGTVFTLLEKSRIYAAIEINKGLKHLQKVQVFHVDWIGPEGKSMYIKRIDLSENDSTGLINSSISLSPETRHPGKYKLRVYLFRELIAEKKFEIFPEFQLVNSEGQSIQSTIMLYRKKSKKTGKLMGEDSVFVRKQKRKLRADLRLENRFVYGQQELQFLLEWQGPGGQTIYQKKIDLQANDSTAVLYSSISIPPESRPAGEYHFSVYLFDKLINQQKFELK